MPVSTYGPAAGRLDDHQRPPGRRPPGCPASSTTASGLRASASRRPSARPRGHGRDGQQGHAAAVEPDAPAARRPGRRRGSPASSAGQRHRPDPPAGLAAPPRPRALADGGAGRRGEGGDRRVRDGEVEVEEPGVERRAAGALRRTTCTCSGSPVAASTQTSTRRTDDGRGGRGQAQRRGRRGRPPAGRRSGTARRRPPPTAAGGRASSAAGPAARAASSGLAARAGGGRRLVLPRPGAARVRGGCRSRRPAVTTSTRLSAGPRHQTRIVVRSLNRSATELSWSVTGSARLPAETA